MSKNKKFKIEVQVRLVSVPLSNLHPSDVSIQLTLSRITGLSFVENGTLLALKWDRSDKYKGSLESIIFSSLFFDLI